MVSKNQYPFEYKDDCSPYVVTLPPGVYLFQAWGATGGGDINYGKGGYVEGQLFLYYHRTFYVYVGGQGKSPLGSNGALKSCGGGGGGGIGKRYIDGEIKRGGYGGGGSSDVRLIEDDVKTRIVAAGGGGISGDIGYSSGGNAGGISSERVLCYNKVDFSDYANQTYGYDLLYGEDGRDGKEYVGTGSEGNGGAGGGYYGGKVTHSNKESSSCGGAGGSSFLSGYPLCERNYYTFKNGDVRSGSDSFPEHNGLNKRDGFVLITFIGNAYTQSGFIIQLKVLIVSLFIFVKRSMFSWS